MGKKTSSSANKDFELGRAVADVVTITDIKLMGLNAQLGSIPSRDLIVDVQVATAAQRAPFDEKLFRVLVQVTLKAYEETRGEKDPFLLHEATHEIQYSLATVEGIEQANLDAFGRVNAVFNAWPYARELVQSTMTRMGLPAFMLPAIRIGSDKFSSRITMDTSTQTSMPSA